MHSRDADEYVFSTKHRLSDRCDIFSTRVGLVWSCPDSLLHGCYPMTDADFRKAAEMILKQLQDHPDPAQLLTQEVKHWFECGFAAGYTYVPEDLWGTKKD